MKAATMASRRVEFSMTMFWDNGVRLAWLSSELQSINQDLKWKVPTRDTWLYIFSLVSMSLDTLAAICIAKEKAQFFFVSFAIYVPCNETVPPTGIDHPYEIQRRLKELSELTGPLRRDR